LLIFFLRQEKIFSCRIGNNGRLDKGWGAMAEKCLEKIINKLQEDFIAQKEQLRVILQLMGDGLVITDAHGRIQSINRAAEELTGWKQGEIEGQQFARFFRIIDEETREPIVNPVEQVLKEGTPVDLKKGTQLLTKGGLVRPICNRAAPFKDAANRILGAVFVFRDVSQEKIKKETIYYLSYHDQLTGLYNRAFFEEELRRLDTERQLPISLILGDINGLKITNDVYGHKEGDLLLKSIAKVITKCCRSEDIIARWGGDEFVILLPQTPSKCADDICQRIRSTCLKESTESLKLSISLGYATKEKMHQNIMDVFRKAEDYMYKRKLLENKSLRCFIISSMKKAMYERGFESEEHVERLTYLTKGIGIALGLKENELEDLALLSMLHDIGKSAIPDSILSKPGELNDEEWLEIKKHPIVGYRIAQSVPELVNIAEYILSHHERWDGKGYPQGLKGENIPLLARIIAVADAYDAMVQERPYQKAVSHLKACEELTKNAGTQFDPRVVQAFLDFYLVKPGCQVEHHLSSAMELSTN